MDIQTQVNMQTHMKRQTQMNMHTHVHINALGLKRKETLFLDSIFVWKKKYLRNFFLEKRVSKRLCLGSVS